MGDIEICTSCKQSFEIDFSEFTSGNVLRGEIYFFCRNCYNLYFNKTFNYENGIPNGHLDLPEKTLEFINKDGFKIEIVQKGYIFNSIKKMNIEGTLIYEKHFLSFETPQSDFKDIRNYFVRKYYDNGLLKYESYKVGYYEKYKEMFTHYTSPIKEWYPNGVLQSEKLPNVFEKTNDDEGYLLEDNSYKNTSKIKKRWYKDIDMCLVKSDFMDYYGDIEEDIYVLDRLGNKYKGAFDKLDNLVPYTINQESNAKEYRIINKKYDELYREWFENGILAKDIFRKYPRINWANHIEVLNGNYKIYNLQGVLVEEVTYKNDKLNGIYRKRDWDSSILLKEYNFEKDRMNGLCREWDLSGNLLKEHNYVKNKFNGLCREWSSYNGILLKEHNYKDHKLEGLCREFNDEGNLIKSGNFTNGKCVDKGGKKVIIKKMEIISL